jgi:DNA polymerase-1
MSFFDDKVLSDINMDSNKQILNILNSYDIPVSDTSKHSLAPYLHNPLVQAITEYRRTAKLLSTFLYSMPQQIHPVTGRLHPKYSQIGAWSGRMSCGGPNIQQIPRDKHFRACFTALKGNKLVIADYSQIELRVVAEISRDERMIRAYRNGEDLHRLTASLISGKHIEAVTKEERQSAKAMNFGLVFAMGAKGLQSYAKETYDVDMTLDQAVQFRNRFFHSYQGVAAWHKRLKNNPPAQSRTVAGRKHVYGGQAGLSGLCNTPVQGSAADIIKNALGRLVDRLSNTNTKIVAVVHDEIVLETECEKAAQVAGILKDTMESAGAEYLSLVPLLAEVQIADSWAEK